MSLGYSMLGMDRTARPGGLSEGASDEQGIIRDVMELVWMRFKNLWVSK